MPTDKLDMNKVKSFLTQHLKALKDASTIKLRKVQKAIAKEFGQGMFMPRLSALVRSIRPDYVAKPAPARRKTGKRPGPGRLPGVREGAGRPSTSTNRSEYMIRVGRKAQTVRSHARLQAVVDKILASGASIGKLKIFRLVPVTVATKVEIGT